ncbi:MAG: NVEALA domain-containing protein [Paludibacter sp.]|nr:NVEALA domain-containing protein [Paludibacter sp.]
MFGSLAIVVIAVVVTFNVNLNVKKSDTASLLALANVEALADEEEFIITCDSGDSGQCFYVSVIEGLFGMCQFDCDFSGSQNDYCSQCWVDLINFCSAFGCASGG